MAATFIRDCSGIFVVYSVEDRSSFSDAKERIKYAREEANNKISILLIGNKCDLEDKRAVEYDEGLQLSIDEGLQGFYETSAKCNINV